MQLIAQFVAYSCVEINSYLNRAPLNGMKKKRKKCGYG